MSKKVNIAIVPGSFDPITYGHIDIVKRAAKQYDVVYLAVMINTQKEYMFSISERKQIAMAALADIENVEVISSEGMLWELAKELSASAIVKGYRNDKDLEYEINMAEYNKQHYPNAETILLKSNPCLINVSSTAVREKIQKSEPLTGFLPEAAIAEINKILKKF